MRKLTLVALGLGATLSAVAAPFTVTSYDMLNGNGQASGGSYNYWDLNYTGSGSTTTDNAALSGGVGDLTDGVITNDNWFSVENGAGTGPYVGWYNQDPTITFNFGSSVNLDAIAIHVDDSNGAGGVDLPDAVVINGTWYDVDQFAAGSEPKWLTFGGLGITGSSVDVQLIRSNAWVFADEFEFRGEAVPEPASMLVLALGALFARKRKS
jgi:hypothetical protein